MKIKRLETPKLPTAFQFGVHSEFLSIDFCTDDELPPSEEVKVSFSTIVLTKSTAKKMHKALGNFINDNNGND